MESKVLRDLIEEDIDKVLNNKEVNDKNFFWIIIHYLLDNDRINLLEVDNLSTELKEGYMNFLASFEEELIESGEIITVLGTAIRKFFDRMKPILNKIDRIKKNASCKDDIN